MKVICKKNKLTKNDNFEILVLTKPEKERNIYDDNYYIIDDGYYDIDYKTVGYDLKINNVYDVYGIMIFKNIIRYLIVCESFSEVIWIQQEAFDIVDSRLPYNWHCNNFISENENGIIIGYKELANNYQHLIDLMLKKETAIKVFLEQKDNMEYFE